MNIEESVEYLKKCLNDEYNFKNATRKKDKEAIETLLTAYEKEKGENVKLRLQDIPLIEGELKAYKDRVKELKEELEKEKEKNKELESDKEQLKYEIDCLKNDIKNMYCEEAVITIIEDNFDLSREEVIQILGEE